MQMTCRWWKGWGRLKEPDSSNQGAGWRSWLPTRPNGWLRGEPALPPGAGAASGCSRGHAPEAEPPGGPAAAAEGGAGRARVSETEPQVAAGARLGPSSEVSGFPPMPLARAAPRAHAPCPAVPVATRAQRCGGTWRDGEQGLGRGEAAGWAPCLSPR